MNTSRPFIDWLSFTIRTYNQYTIDLWIDFLGGKALERSKGYLNYNKAVNTNFGALIAWNFNNIELGLYISLSAKSLKLICDNGIDTINLINKAINSGAKFTRVDLTIDDFDNFLDLNQLLDKIKKDEIRTKLRTYNTINSQTEQSYTFIESGVIGKETTGKTIYLGNPKKSNAFIRIYDKKLQTKRIDLPSWNRVELVLRHENADQFLNNHIKINSTGEISKKGENLIKLIPYEQRSIPNLIYYYLDFLDVKRKKSGEITHKRHWRTSPFWLDFLNTSEKEKIGLPKYESGLEELKIWALKSIAGLDQTLEKIYGNEYLDAKKEQGEKSIDKNKKYQSFIKNAII
jgi:hypothetical protein